MLRSCLETDWRTAWQQQQEGSLDEGHGLSIGQNWMMCPSPRKQKSSWQSWQGRRRSVSTTNVGRGSSYMAQATVIIHKRGGRYRYDYERKYILPSLGAVESGCPSLRADSISSADTFYQAKPKSIACRKTLPRVRINFGKTDRQ